MLKVLKRELLAKVKMQMTAGVGQFELNFVIKYSILNNVYYITDGGKLYLRKYGDKIIQNMFYNGWINEEYVGIVFQFAPNGIVIAFAINAPVAMNKFIISE